jgi:hypothetical protein
LSSSDRKYIRCTCGKIDPETEDIQNYATAADEIDLYLTTNFDCDDGDDVPMLPLAFLKIASPLFPEAGSYF